MFLFMILGNVMMENPENYFHYEKGRCAFEDYFGFADCHPDSLESIDALLPAVQKFHSFLDALRKR